ncbi:Mu transposase C-terminal domain-containing protein [Chamaesiphon minutus]|uniref:Integrase family protein n=1 Tax=Chamaesiphon minutus (strain ATCC 27169 / PCC 6605) TaxID=1173020 RepID=K9UCI2_CHAP6|nr:Mu transposase C-terminal domain-containing protein [Chamaesiphon minutus]AFY92787.1 integrase family protein [Chamaesiphon minutus PCC 6605]
MKQWYSAFELAGLPDLPALPNNVARKAKAEQWQSRQRTGRGGGREYAYNSLPQTAQTALIHNSGRIVDVNIEPSIGSPKVRPQVQQVKPTSEQRIDAWLAILRAYEHWCASNTFETVLDRDTAFVRAYNDRQLALVNWVYAYLPKLSRSTLKAKQKLRREAPTISALGGNYGHRRGTGRIDSDPDLPAAIETCLAAGGKHWGASQIYDILQFEFGLDPETCSLGQVRAWLRQFRSNRPQEWAMYMSPDRVKGTVSPAFGSRSQNVFRPNQVWEIDSMRVDIECKSERAGEIRLDRVFVIACIDIFTRRVMLKVSAQNNGEAVCLLIARAILKWGVPEQIRTDCGKEYLSRRVQRFLANLGVDTEDLRCLPGHPEQKPFVERFNRTFQHRDLVKNPFFVGHSVAERQSLRASSNRNCAGIELAMSVEDFQRWCDLWRLDYEQRPHGRAGIGLEGKSPLEVLAAAVDGGWVPHQIHNPRELDFLMMTAPGKEGTRQVGRQGISVCGRLYVAAELAGWIGKTVYVCFDPQQPRTIYVYGSDRLTKFVCQAVWREAADIDLADIANRARHLYEILLRSVSQIRKRGKTLLRKLASDPYLLVGKTAQELTEVFKSKLHDYPAIQAITAAITESEARSDVEPPTIELERYHQELKRLEAESEQQLLLQEQQQSRQYRVEELINRWQQQQTRPVLETSELELLMQHLSLPEGRGFLAAVTSTERRK